MGAEVKARSSTAQGRAQVLTIWNQTNRLAEAERISRHTVLNTGSQELRHCARDGIQFLPASQHWPMDTDVYVR